MRDELLRAIGLLTVRPHTRIEQMCRRKTTYGTLFCHGYVVRATPKWTDQSTIIRFIRTNPMSASAIVDMFRFKHLVGSKRFLVYDNSEVIVQFDDFEDALATLALIG